MAAAFAALSYDEVNARLNLLHRVFLRADQSRDRDAVFLARFDHRRRGGTERVGDQAHGEIAADLAQFLAQRCVGPLRAPEGGRALGAHPSFFEDFDRHIPVLRRDGRHNFVGRHRLIEKANSGNSHPTISVIRNGTFSLSLVALAGPLRLLSGVQGKRQAP